MQHRPRALVGADLQSPPQAQCRDPVFAGSEQPAGVEPYGERRTRPVKDRACYHRRMAAAPGALEPVLLQIPARKTPLGLTWFSDPDTTKQVSER